MILSTLCCFIDKKSLYIFYDVIIFIYITFMLFKLYSQTCIMYVYLIQGTPLQGLIKTFRLKYIVKRHSVGAFQ